MALLVLVEPLGDAGVVEGVSVVGAVQDVLLGPPVHHLSSQGQHLACMPCLRLEALHRQLALSRLGRNLHRHVHRASAA